MCVRRGRQGAAACARGRGRARGAGAAGPGTGSGGRSAGCPRRAAGGPRSTLRPRPAPAPSARARARPAGSSADHGPSSLIHPGAAIGVGAQGRSRVERAPGARARAHGTQQQRRTVRAALAAEQQAAGGRSGPPALHALVVRARPALGHVLEAGRHDQRTRTGCAFDGRANAPRRNTCAVRMTQTGKRFTPSPTRQSSARTGRSTKVVKAVNVCMGSGR